LVKGKPQTGTHGRMCDVQEVMSGVGGALSGFPL
jgi:hypothetical protein